MPGLSNGVNDPNDMILIIDISSKVHYANINFSIERSYL